MLKVSNLEIRFLNKIYSLKNNLPKSIKILLNNNNNNCKMKFGIKSWEKNNKKIKKIVLLILLNLLKGSLDLKETVELEKIPKKFLF